MTQSENGSGGGFPDALNRFIEKHSDLLLAIGVVVILGLLVVRIPPAAMDWFIAGNISVGFIVLMVALYIKNALRLPSFPTILLLSTLFRLALNVSTTRLILLEADAGEIIHTFGQFVVGGNFVVGAVVFLVLVIVQFVVIAKGSERVAEVAARFTLDAMPGKQMSIDADLRNDLIDAAGAKKRRQDLEKESRLYGAMDGAMKFVKGDAIAGIIISIVNIIGGLIIGVMQQGMSAGEAAEIYSLLTIGDGLVSQIPALLISVSAGLVVTRVAGGDDDDEASVPSMASDMFEQVSANPKGLAIAAGMLFVMGATGPVTGFPTIPFLVLGAILGSVAWSRLGADRRKAAPAAVYAGAVEGAVAAAPDAGSPAGPAAEAPPEAHGAAPLILSFDPGLSAIFLPEDAGEQGELLREIAQQREARSRDMGIRFPPVSFRVTDRPADSFGYSILAYEGVIARDRASTFASFVVATPEIMEAKGYDVAPVVLPGWRLTVSLLADQTQLDRAVTEGLPLISARQAILGHLDRVCCQRADLFMGIQEASELVDDLRDERPDLVKAVMPTLLTLQQITEVLRLLLREQVPVRDLRQVFETMARWAGDHKDPNVLVELVRRDMRLTLCSRFAGQDNVLRYYSLNPEIESLVHENATGRPLSPEHRIEIASSLGRVIDPRHHVQKDPVVLVRNPLIRAALRRLIEDRLPEVHVLAQEITSGFRLQEMGRATLTEEPV